MKNKEILRLFTILKLVVLRWCPIYITGIIFVSWSLYFVVERLKFHPTFKEFMWRTYIMKLVTSNDYKIINFIKFSKQWAEYLWRRYCSAKEIVKLLYRRIVLKAKNFYSNSEHYGGISHSFCISEICYSCDTTQ